MYYVSDLLVTKATTESVALGSARLWERWKFLLQRSGSFSNLDWLKRAYLRNASRVLLDIPPSYFLSHQITMLFKRIEYADSYKKPLIFVIYHPRFQITSIIYRLCRSETTMIKILYIHTFVTVSPL